MASPRDPLAACPLNSAEKPSLETRQGSNNPLQGQAVHQNATHQVPANHSQGGWGRGGVNARGHSVEEYSIGSIARQVAQPF